MSKPTQDQGTQGAGAEGTRRPVAAGRPRRAAAHPNPAADEGLNPLTTGAASDWGPSWVHRGEGEGVDTPAPYNPVSNSVGFQQFATRPEAFHDAPQLARDDPAGAGVVTPSPTRPPAPERPQQATRGGEEPVRQGPARGRGERPRRRET